MLNQRVDFDAVQVGLLMLDARARVMRLNAPAQMLLRTPASHAQGIALTHWFTADDTLNQVIHHIHYGYEDVCRGALRMVRYGDGSELEQPMQIYVALSHIHQDEGDCYLLECFDLSAYEQVQQDAQWHAQVQSLQLLVRQLAHEIKNPLGGIRGATQLLQDELETVQPELVEYTEMVLGEVDRLRSLVDQFLIPYRQGMAQSVPVNIHEICESVYRLVQVEYSTQVSFTRDYDVSVPSVLGVADYLQQMLLNLVQNAAQAVLRDSDGAPKVTIRTRIARNCMVNQVKRAMMLEVSIIDNGEGVPEAIYDTLFLPMVTQREGGTGLGLSVSMQIARQHGGTIEVQSRKGRTQMRVLLPIEAGFIPSSE